MDNYEDMPVFEEPDFLQSEPPAQAVATPAPVVAPAAPVVAPAAPAAAKPAPTLKTVDRPLPGADLSDEAFTRLEQQYMRLTRSSMSLEIRATLYGIMQENNIKYNDAAMAFIIVLVQMLEKVNLLPHNIDIIQEKAAHDIVQLGEKAIQDEIKKTSAQFTQSVNRLISERVSGGGKWYYEMKWTIPVLIAGFVFGNVFPKLEIINELLWKLFVHQ